MYGSNTMSHPPSRQPAALDGAHIAHPRPCRIPQTLPATPPPPALGRHPEAHPASCSPLHLTPATRPRPLSIFRGIEQTSGPANRQPATWLSPHTIARWLLLAHSESANSPP